jgi:hypothetical protein
MLGARGRFGHAHSAVVLTGVDMVDQESIDRINILEESDRAVENSNGQRRPLLGIHFAQKRSVVMGVACPSRALTSVMGALAAKATTGTCVVWKPAVVAWGRRPRTGPSADTK